MTDTFSLAQLRGDLDELYRLLAELMEIDLILDGLQARGALQSSAGFVQPAKVLTLGTTEPFDLLYYDATVADDPGRASRSGPLLLHQVDLGFIAEAAGEAEAFRTAAQASLERLLDPLVLVRPEELRGLADVLVALYLTMHGSVHDDFAGLRNEGADWEGEAADAFFDSFYEPLAQVRANHLWAIDYLTSLTAHLKLINDLGQHSLANLVGCALDTVREQLHERRLQHRGESAFSTLAFLTASSGILGIIAFPGAAGVGIALGSISYMLGYASSQVPSTAQTAPIAGSSAREIHHDLESRVREVCLAVGEGFDTTHERVQSMRRSIDTMQRGGGGSVESATPARADVWLPKIPDLVAGGDFYHESSGRGR